MYRKLALAVVLAHLIGCATLWAADVQTGDWRLNVAKSQYKTATPPKSQTVTIVPQGKDGVKVTVNAVNAKGEQSTIEYAAQYDGKEYPRNETGPGAVPGQMVTLKRIDDHTVDPVELSGSQTLTAPGREDFPVTELNLVDSFVGVVGDEGGALGAFARDADVPRVPTRAGELTDVGQVLVEHLHPLALAIDAASTCDRGAVRRHAVQAHGLTRMVDEYEALFRRTVAGAAA